MFGRIFHGSDYQLIKVRTAISEFGLLYYFRVRTTILRFGVLI